MLQQTLRATISSNIDEPPNRDIDLGRLVFTVDARSLRHMLNTTSYDGARNPKQILQAEAAPDVSNRYITYICLSSIRLSGIRSTSPPLWNIGVREEVHFLLNRNSYRVSRKVIGKGGLVVTTA
jgi:hypothetical protein